MILSSGVTYAEEQIRNSHFKGNMDGWWNAGANIATESNEACIDIKTQERILGMSFLATVALV